MKVPQIALAVLALYSTGALAIPHPHPLSSDADDDDDKTDTHLPERRDESSETPPSAPKEPPRPKEYKYFHEPGGDDIMGHYDIRYYQGVVSDDVRIDTLKHMTRAYLNFFREHGLETWIAHGTLLGWWWNGQVCFILHLALFGP